MDRIHLIVSLLDLVLSLNYVQNLILGIGLVLGSARLSTWRPFHYLLGSGGGILLSVLLGLYLIFKHTRSTVGSVPGSRLVVQGGGSLALYLFPLSGVVFFNTIVQLVYSMVGLLAQLYASESTLGIPHFGKIYVMMFATMGTFLVWWYQWLSPAKVHGSSNLDESELGVTHTSVLIVEPEEEWESDELDMEVRLVVWSFGMSILNNECIGEHDSISRSIAQNLAIDRRSGDFTQVCGSMYRYV